jgi:chaperonin GroEL (HSP60 family)
MTGKGIELFMKKLSEISIDAAIAVSESGKIDVEDTVKVVKIPGGRLEDSTINYGVVVEKERLDPGMPKKVENARIVLLEGTLELKKLGTDAKITISKADELQSFKQGEELVLQKQVEALVAVGANVVFCQKGIGLTASRFLSKHGILAARRVKDEDLKMLSLATGGKVIADPMQITEQDLGHCRLVEERKVGDDHMIFVEDCAKAKAVSIILHGVSEQFLDEIERAMNDALHVVLDVLKSGKIVPGGGAQRSRYLREFGSMHPASQGATSWR